MVEENKSIPRGYWVVYDELKKISDMTLEEIRRIVEKREAKGQWIHPEMAKRLGKPVEQRKGSERPRTQKTFRNV